MSGGRTPVVAAILVALVGGCRLPGMDGAASRSLVTSRQLSQQGVAALERGQSEHADELLGQAVRACPSNADAHRSYAEARWSRGFREEALKEIEAARRLAPDNAAILARIAEMRLAMGQRDVAWEAAQKAIAMEPKLAPAWVVRARVLHAAGNSAQALADYHRAQSFSPDDRSIPYGIAALYLELKQPQRALLAIQGMADKYSPGDEPQEVLYYQGLSYLALQRYDDAADSLSAATLRERPTAEIFCRLAEAQWSAGRSAEALAAAEQALAIDPEHKPTRALLAQAELARQTDAPQRR
jgi:tetratricopeptide (TPR) repeat protein